LLRANKTAYQVFPRSGIELRREWTEGVANVGASPLQATQEITVAIAMAAVKKLAVPVVAPVL
jgi:hypothetical protein